MSESKSEFYSKVATIAIPVIIQNLIMTSLNVVDGVMVGSLGTDAIAAVGICNQIFFIMTFILIGINSGAAIFTAQYWGVDDKKSIVKALEVTMIINIVLGAAFSLAVTLIPENIISIYTANENVISLGSGYLKIIGYSYMFTAIVFGYTSILKSIGKAKFAMYVSGMAFIINTVLNYMLIFGKLGFAAMGVNGSATATLIARMAEFLFLIAGLHFSKSFLRIRFKEMMVLDFDFIKRYLKVSVSLILNTMSWSLGIAVYNIIYSRIGTDSFAAVNVAVTLEGMAFVVFTGLSTACNTMVGNKLGADDYERAYEYGKNFLKIAFVSAVGTGIVLAAAGIKALGFYKLSQTSYKEAHKILMIMGIMLCIKVSNMIVYQGILRSGGDTKYALKMSLISMWGIGVPVMIFVSVVLKLPIYLVVLFSVTEELVKIYGGLKRFYSKVWAKNVIA